ncbi:46422_t:CDS:2, partial [Gigaspora margarita]
DGNLTITSNTTSKKNTDPDTTELSATSATSSITSTEDNLDVCDINFELVEIAEIVSGQKDDGFIELGDTVCNELDAPKEEIITTIHKNIKNSKLKSPELISTAVNLSYLNKATLKHESLWRDKYNKVREYLSKQIGYANTEKELLECADNYKVIKDKKKNAVAKLQDSTTPEKCNDVTSYQKDDGSFEVNETICKEIDIPVDVVPVVKKEIQNEKLKSPESEPWWKTALTLSYLKVAA